MAVQGIVVQRGVGPRGVGAPALGQGSARAWSDAFQGRERELERLRCALHMLSQGEPARMLVLGETGSGKSRLLDEAVSNASPARVAILRGRALEFEMDRPFGVLVDALDLRVDSLDPHRAALGRLVLRARDPARAEERHNLVRRIVELVDSLCCTGPLALLLEDMQWTDVMSATAVGAILEALSERPLGVFMTSRKLPFNPAAHDLLERAHPEVERVELDALPSDAVNALVRSLTGGQPSPRLARLVTGAGGNPGLVITLLDGLRDDGMLTVMGETSDTDTTEPPASMHTVVMARVSRLPDRCQDLLIVAAVLGEPLEVAMLAAAVGRSVIEVLADLRQAMAAGIIAEVDGILGFRHELVRVILYKQIPASTRSIFHRRVDIALRIAGAGATVVERWQTLTKAEREVVRHVVAGLSNREIGQRLFVSARTVETHLSHVFAKLGMSSRVELTGAVVRAEAVRDRPADKPGASSNGKNGHI